MIFKYLAKGREHKINSSISQKGTNHTDLAILHDLWSDYFLT